MLPLNLLQPSQKRVNFVLDLWQFLFDCQELVCLHCKQTSLKRQKKKRCMDIGDWDQWSLLEVRLIRLGHLCHAAFSKWIFLQIYYSLIRINVMLFKKIWMKPIWSKLIFVSKYEAINMTPVENSDIIFTKLFCKFWHWTTLVFHLAFIFFAASPACWWMIIPVWICCKYKVNRWLLVDSYSRTRRSLCWLIKTSSLTQGTGKNI